jgi:hypothetical protein
MKASLRICNIKPCAESTTFSMEGEFLNASLDDLKVAAANSGFKIHAMSDSNLIAKREQLLLIADKYGWFSLSRIVNKDEGTEIISEIAHSISLSVGPG